MPRGAAWIAAGSLLALVAAGTLVSRLFADPDDWIVVGEGDLAFEVEITGTLEAVESVHLGPPQLPEVWQFKLSFMAPEGVEVEQGRRVLAFDTSDLVRELDEKRNERDGARQELTKRRGELEIRAEEERRRLAEAEAGLRRTSLKVERPAEVVAGIELQLARLDHDLAVLEVDYLRARIEDLERAAAAELRGLAETLRRAEHRVEEIEESISRMNVRAPQAGTVVHSARRGMDKFKVGDTVWRMHHVLEIPDLRTMRAQGEVEEADAGRVRAGQPARLRLDAHPDIELHGIVEAVGQTFEPRSRRNPTKVARIRLALDETDPQRMRPGMRFRGQVETGRAEGVLTAPLEAVEQGPQGPLVYRRTAAGARPLAVELGRRSRERVEVVAGLAAGDRILARAPAGLDGRGR